MVFNCFDLNIYYNIFNIYIGLACLKDIYLIYTHIILVEFTLITINHMIHIIS